MEQCAPVSDIPTPSPILDERPAGPARIHAVEDAIVTRRSIRAFLPTPVADDTVRRILAVAARAPSGTNTQPWKVYVLTGAAKERLCARVAGAYDDPAQAATHREDYDYYPTEWKSPYIDRRRKVGWDLYGLLGIGRQDKARMHAQHARNYRFFDAPVGLMFTIDRIMPRGSWLDYGGFLEAIMVAARGHGLHTCPQQSWARFHRIVMPLIGASAHEQLICGMALGHADWSRIENTLVTEREPVEGFVRFVPAAAEGAG
jgi:nitroreductase